MCKASTATKNTDSRIGYRSAVDAIEEQVRCSSRRSRLVYLWLTLSTVVLFAVANNTSGFEGTVAENLWHER